MKSMKKILFLTTEKDSANGICTKTVMQEFAQKDFKIYFITNDLNPKNKNYIEDNIIYYTVRPRFVRYLELKNNKSAKNKLIKNICFILNKMKLLMSYPTWPLISPLYTYRIYKLAKKICINEKIDCIIPVYTQIDTLIAAHFIKKQLNIKYIPYFLDSLSGGYGPKILSKNWVIKRGLKWEEILLSNADRIIMMESSRKHYEKYKDIIRFYNKIVFLDLPLLKQVDIKEKNNILKNDKINLVYTGSLPLHIRNPEYFIKVFKNISNPNLRLYLIGVSESADKLKKYQNEDERIIIVPHVTHDIAISVINDADVLVNFGNNLPTMAPSKIFEYMSTGKPIISTCPIKDEPSKAYLEKYPYHLFIFEDEGSDSAANKVDEFIKNNLGKRAKFEQIESLFFKNTPKVFFEIIDKELNEKRNENSIHK